MKMYLLDLPDECVLQVVTKLPDVKDMLTFQRCNRKCLEITREPTLWLWKIRRDYGLKLKVTLGYLHHERGAIAKITASSFLLNKFTVSQFAVIH